MSDHQLLSGFSVFSDFSVKELEEVAKQIEVHEFDQGDIVFYPGENADKFYGVLSGEVELVLVVREAVTKTEVQFEEYTRAETEEVVREIVIDYIQEGEVLGWTALTPLGKYATKAVCAKPAKLISLPADSLKEYFSQSPHVGYPFMQHLAHVITHRFANRTDRLIEGWVEAFDVNRI